MDLQGLPRTQWVKWGVKTTPVLESQRNILLGIPRRGHSVTTLVSNDKGGKAIAIYPEKREVDRNGNPLSMCFAKKASPPLLGA